MLDSAGHGVPLWTFMNLSKQPGIRHFVTTRAGGVSTGPLASLNLGYRTSDLPNHVLENRSRLANRVDIALGRLIFGNQVHGKTVRIVTNRSLSAEEKPALPDCDALVTADPNLMVTVLLADCVPVLLCDPVTRVVAAAHAGWRGTVSQIAGETVHLMEQTFGSRPTDMIAGIGPSIGPCCYEVGTDVILRVRDSLPAAETLLLPAPKPERAHFDLWKANRDQLLACGVLTNNIELASLCTRCQHEQFFSERYQPGSGRFAAGIMLLADKASG